VAFYCFDFDTGSDSNTAPYSPTNALKNLPGTAEVTPGSQADFNPQPGDVLSLARGSVWELAGGVSGGYATCAWLFTSADSGTSGSPITIQAHDRNGETGQSKPVVSLMEIFSSGDWTHNGSGIWRTTVNASIVRRVFFNWVGQSPNATSVATVNSTDTWWFDGGSTLYVYTGNSSGSGDPNSVYGDVRTSQRSNNQDMLMLIEDCAYININDIEFRGSGVRQMQLTLRTSGATAGGLEVKNCNMYYSGARVIEIDSIVPNESFVGQILLESNDFDIKNGGTAENLTTAPQGYWDGVQVKGGINDNLTIRYNRFADFKHTCLRLDPSSGTLRIVGGEIYENYFTTSKANYGRAWEVFNIDATASEDAIINTRVYRNLAYKTKVSSKCGGKNTWFYQNVVDTVDQQTAEAADRSQAFTLGRGLVKGVTFANNIIRNTFGQNFYIQSYADYRLQEIYLYNNILIQEASQTNDLRTLTYFTSDEAADVTPIVRNNKLYSANTTSHVRYSGTAYTVAGMDAARSECSNNIATNETFFGTIQESDFASTPIRCSMWFSKFGIDSGSNSVGAGLDWWGANPPTNCDGSTWTDATIDIGLNEQTSGVITGTGALNSQSSSIDGVGVHQDLGTGSLVSEASNVEGIGFVIPQAGGEITLIGFDVSSLTPGSASHTLNLGAYAADDFALILGYNDNRTASGPWAITGATGWIELGTINNTQGQDRLSTIFYKKLTASETNPTAELAGTAEPSSASVHVFRGVDPDDPFGSPSPFYTSIDYVANLVQAPNASITTDQDNSAIVVFHGINGGQVAAAGAPSGYTLGGTVIGPNRNQFAAYLLDSGTAGLKSPGDWTHTGTTTNDDGLTWTIALNPAAGGGGTVGLGFLEAQSSAVAGSGTVIQAVTGSGSLDSQTSAVAGIGGVVETGTGDLQSEPSAISGTGTAVETVAGTGDLQSSPATIAGAGTQLFAGTGDLATQPAEITGVGTQLFIGAGALQVQESQVTGAGNNILAGTGDLAAQTSEIAGTGTQLFAGTGALDAQASEISGAGTAIEAITGAGDLQADISQISGAGVQLLTGTGDLSAQQSEITGAGTQVITGTGDLTAQDAQILGTGGNIVAGTGSLTAQTSEIAGSGTVTGFTTGTGDLQADASQIAGAGVQVITGTGALQAQESQILGTAGNIFAGTGALAANDSSVAGAGLQLITGTGDLQAQTSQIIGTGGDIVAGTGALAANDSVVSGAGIQVITGTGDLQAQTSSIDGVGASVDVIIGTGALAANDSAISGAGTQLFTGTGDLQAQSSAVVGAADGIFIATGNLSAQASAVAGVGDVSITDNAIMFGANF